MTARQIIEARFGKPLGPLAAMPPDHLTAVKLLAQQLMRIKSDKGADPDALLLDGRHKTERERNNG